MRDEPLAPASSRDIRQSFALGAPPSSRARGSNVAPPTLSPTSTSPPAAQLAGRARIAPTAAPPSVCSSGDGGAGCDASCAYQLSVEEKLTVTLVGGKPTSFSAVGEALTPHPPPLPQEADAADV